MKYNIYKKVSGHRSKYKKIYSTEDWGLLNKKIDEELFMNGTKPDDLLVRGAGFEVDRIKGEIYGWD